MIRSKFLYVLAGIATFIGLAAAINVFRGRIAPAPAD
jgi:hypothetical protein